MNYLICYFSATGNTERAVRIVAKELETGGDIVELRRIGTERPDAAAVDRADRLIVAFPTLAWIPPVFVQRFMRRLPNGHGKNAAVLAADGGGCLSAPAAAASILKRRGYRVTLADRASYTENWTQVMPIPDETEQAEHTAAGDAMAADFARRLAAGETGVYRPPAPIAVMSRAIGFLFALFGRRFLGKGFIADGRCTSCGLCVRTCPVGCIELSSRPNARPVWRSNCEDCNRCINICPVNAINMSVARLALIVAAITGLSMGGISLAANIGNPVLRFFATVSAVVLAHIVAIGPLDRLIVPIQRLPPFEPLFSWSYTRSWRRYRAPGFQPERRGKTPQ